MSGQNKSTAFTRQGSLRLKCHQFRRDGLGNAARVNPDSCIILNPFADDSLQHFNIFLVVIPYLV